MAIQNNEPNPPQPEGIPDNHVPVANGGRNAHGNILRRRLVQDMYLQFYHYNPTTLIWTLNNQISALIGLSIIYPCFFPDQAILCICMFEFNTYFGQIHINVYLMANVNANCLTIIPICVMNASIFSQLLEPVLQLYGLQTIMIITLFQCICFTTRKVLNYSELNAYFINIIELLKVPLKIHDSLCACLIFATESGPFLEWTHFWRDAFY